MPKAAPDSQFKFPKQYRLLTQADFQSVFDHPFKLKHRSWVVLSKKNALGYARLGILIGKHLVRSAVQRNAIRRMVRESFRHRKEEVKGLDIVLIFRSSHSTKRLLGELQHELDELWIRLKSPH